VKFREFKRFAGDTFEQTHRWMVTELNSVMRELYIGLRALTFKENFACFQWEGEIQPGEEVGIKHTLGATPTSFIPVRSGGTCLLVIGDTPATPTMFYVRNIASSSVFKGAILILP
jgi:hypothetical protein